MSEVFPEKPITSLPAAVAAMGALPMPVGPEPRTLDVAEDELTGASLSLWEEERATERLRWALASARRGRARLRAQVAALLAERHTTNEALSEAAEALRADRDGPALPWAASMDDGDLSMFLDDMVSAAMGRWRSEPEVPDRTVLADIERVCREWRTPGQGLRGDAPEGPSVAESADKLSRFFSPVASLREDPHDLPVAADLPVPEGCRLDADELDEVSRRFIGGGS
jgi:hypothetical protein